MTGSPMGERVELTLRVNDAQRHDDVPARLLLADYLREWCGLPGTHVGCAHGVCGSCTVLLDGAPVRSCLMLAAQAHERDVRTVESLAGDEGLSPLQESFRAHQALQCGFCTPGILMTAQSLVERAAAVPTGEVVEAVAGHICRCTGYEPIVAAIRDALGPTDEAGQS